jgi:hypothetical protein
MPHIIGALLHLKYHYTYQSCGLSYEDKLVWAELLATCWLAGCSEVALPPAGSNAAWVQGQCDATPLGGTCTATCNAGFVANSTAGAPRATCIGATGTWSSVTGSCIGRWLPFRV